MVPPRRRRRPGCRAAVGVCADGRGLGSPQPVRPGPPATVSAPAASLRPGSPPHSGSRSSHSARRPACPLSPAPSSPLSPPSLAHKQDGGCCFFPLPNPPYRLAVAAAAGNEPRGGEKKGRGWASGGRWQGGGAWARAAHTMGEEDPGAGPVPITGSAQGPNAVGASANSPGVARWLLLKGRTWRRGEGSGADSGSIFSRCTLAGEGAWVGSLRRGPVGTGAEGARELRWGRRQVTAQVAE